MNANIGESFSQNFGKDFFPMENKSTQGAMRHEGNAQDVAGKPPEEINSRLREKIEPDREGDPTLIFFSRVNNPVIQEQMADLLLKNEEHAVAERSKLADNYGAGAQSRSHRHVKKTREELLAEIQRRIGSVTQLGGDKTTVYLSKEGEGSFFDIINDEVNMDRSRRLSGIGRKLSPAQFAILLAHEKGHQMREIGGETFLDNAFRETIDWENLEITPAELAMSYHHDDERPPETIRKELREYFDANEILERMSQLKNYFGFKGDEIFTKEHLAYAKKHYIDDTGVNNSMGIFFRAITPEKEAKFIEAMNTFGA